MPDSIMGRGLHGKGFRRRRRQLHSRFVKLISPSPPIAFHPGLPQGLAILPMDSHLPRTMWICRNSLGSGCLCFKRYTKLRQGRMSFCHVYLLSTLGHFPCKFNFSVPVSIQRLPFPTPPVTSRVLCRRALETALAGILTPLTSLFAQLNFYSRFSL